MASHSAFEISAAEIGELFVDYLDGDANRPYLAISQQVLDGEARQAIEKSLAAFGYPPDSCTYATTLPKDSNAEGSDIKLDAQSVFLLVEGLDPLKIICTDIDAARLLASAYRCEIETDTPTRVFGRSAVVFNDFSKMLETTEGKQKAWSLLKSLK